MSTLYGGVSMSQARFKAKSQLRMNVFLNSFCLTGKALNVLFAIHRSSKILLFAVEDTDSAESQVIKREKEQRFQEPHWSLLDSSALRWRLKCFSGFDKALVLTAMYPEAE